MENEDEIKNDYIENALNNLVQILGIREFVDYKKLIFLIRSNKTKESIKEIALYLGLPIEVNISYVSAEYRPSATDGFHSTHLVKTKRSSSGSGNITAGITAQVSIPPDLPLYGTPRMIDFPINVRLSENCAENPATLISVMAHELSHIVLYSIWHKEKENEFYTDLTAMILGFANVMKDGRIVVQTNSFTEEGFLSSSTTTTTQTTKYGYLSDNNFNFAFKKIKNILSKHNSTKKKLLKKLKKFKKQLSTAKKLSFYFTKYLEYLDKNLNQKIHQRDKDKISAFHQSWYTDNFQSLIIENEVNLEKFLKFAENLKNYSKQNIEMMEQYKVQLESISDKLSKQYSLFQKDVYILKKYTSFFYRWKLKFNK